MHITRRHLAYPLPDGRTLLVNALSGALDVVEPGVQEIIGLLLRGQRGVPLEPGIEACLRSRGYLFDSPADEDQRFEQLYAAMMERRASEPVQFAICPTYTCNLRCVYCFEGPITGGPPRVMDTSQVTSAFTAIDAIRRDVHPGAPAALILFGGEPLLQITRRCVELILCQAEARGLDIGVVTNGVQARRFIDLLAKVGGRLRQVQITLDGLASVHDRRRPKRSATGSFVSIVQSIEALLHSGFPVTVRVNVDRDNIAHVPALVSYMEQCGWTLHPRFACYLYPVTAYTNPSRPGILAEDEVLAELLQMFRGQGGQLPSFALYGFKVLGHVASVLDPTSLPLQMPPLFTYCEANGLRYFAFGPDGLIYPCAQALGREALAVGRFHPLFELSGERCQPWVDRSVLTIPRCRACPIATLCGGGCAFGAWVRTGSLQEPNCQGSPHVLDRYIERMRGHIAARV